MRTHTGDGPLTKMSKGRNTSVVLLFSLSRDQLSTLTSIARLAHGPRRSTKPGSPPPPPIHPGAEDGPCARASSGSRWVEIFQRECQVAVVVKTALGSHLVGRGIHHPF